MSNPFEGYKITSPYGNRLDPFGSGKTVFHTGIDLVKSHKSPIHAFTDGTVTHAKLGATGSGLGGYGNVVCVRDKDSKLHLYAHLDSISVKVGDVIKKGKEVGKQGSTGQSTGSHLHYEVRKKATPSFGYATNGTLDPTKYLQDFLDSPPLWNGKVLKKGQVGRITITKKINLWQRLTNGKLATIRVLNPSEVHEVFGYDEKHGGQYLVKEGYITKMAGYFTYTTPSKALLEKAKEYYANL